MKSLVILVTCLWATFSWAKTETQEFDTQGLKTLKIKNTSGDIDISISNDGKAYVTTNKIDFDKDDCKLSVGKDGSDLSIQISDRTTGWFNWNECKVELTVKVPKNLAVSLGAGSSDLNIKGIQGEIQFKLGSGNASIHTDTKSLRGKSGSGSIEVVGDAQNTRLKTGSGNISLTYQGTRPGQVEVKTGSGTIDAKGLSGNAKLKTGSGDITATYVKKITTGSLEVKTGSGDATVFFPKGMTVATEFSTGNGEVKNELGENSSSKFKVIMKAGSGDLNIKTL